MLRKIRLTLAVLFFAAVTLLFLDFTGTLHTWLGWTAKIQFLPALLALNVGVSVPRAADARVRTGVLFGHLSIGSDAGHRCLDGQETEEEPLQLFSCQVVAAIWSVGGFRCSDDSRNQLGGGIARTV